jgi:tRNA threonylcarbamoyladenosine biosynthesis protein TsaE
VNEQATTARAAGQAPDEPAAASVTGTVRVPEPDRMRALGARLAALLGPGDLVVLAGPLGAGKTTLIQGIGKGLGVRGPITSPTFVIARVHPSLRGGPDLVHADAYRLGSRLEVDDLDLDADLDHSVTVVEWGEGLVEDLTPGYLLVSIDRPGGGAGADGPGDADAGVGGTDDCGGDGSPAEPRVVRVAGFGHRWLAAAGPLRAALSDPAVSDPG